MHRFDFKEHSFGINVLDWPDNKTFKLANKNDSVSLWIQDQYSVTWTQKAMAINELVNESNKRENYWYLNYIGSAPSFLVTIGDTANYTNGISFIKLRKMLKLDFWD